ncbi:copper chaperone PCu(A)C [uncultured Sphingomonas sp.]|uniref:copper chaperone PCu(A)C n=1 Tax=uncultured Sphingomonas sp. TaxID=158754 RepID=UPI0025EF2EEB|nr:copper chaperone PCu(A)C [uncultured Sphingomonas sp.]
MQVRWTIAPLLLVAACSSPTSTPVVDKAYVRLAAVPGRPAAAYFVLHGGPRDMTLTQVAVPGVSRAELHNSRTTGNGMVTMDSLATVPVKAHGQAVFAPGARHVMLFDVPDSVRAGSTLPMTLRFADGEAVTANASVIAAGDVAPE